MRFGSNTPTESRSIRSSSPFWGTLFHPNSNFCVADVADVANVALFYVLTGWHPFSLRYTRRHDGHQKTSLIGDQTLPEQSPQKQKGGCGGETVD